MKPRTLLTILALAAMVLLLVACGPASGEQPADEPAAEATVPGLEGAPAGGETSQPDNYPPPEEVLPPGTPTLRSDYPAPPTLPATVDPYPGGLVWIIRPVGIQCEEGTAPGYGDLREATSTVTAAGIKVADSEMTELMVTTSCGSPTSAHFRLQIAADDLDAGLSLGWTQE
jgi:hypothetical protein